MAGSGSGTHGLRQAPISLFPALRSRVPLPPDSPCAADRGGGGARGTGGVGWGRDQSTQCRVPSRTRRAPGTRESPSAPSSPPLGPGVWAWREIRILPGDGRLRVNRRDELSQSTFMVPLLCAERSPGPFQLLGSGAAPSVLLYPRAGIVV